MINLLTTKYEYLVPLILILVLATYLAFKIVTKKEEIVNEQQSIGIQELISQVKTELQHGEATRINKKEGALFAVKSFELEINFVVRRSQSNSSEFKYEVITIGGKNEEYRERAQKIKLVMETIPASTDSIPFDTTAQVPSSNIQSIGPIPPKK